jgi:hypothetical protein
MRRAPDRQDRITALFVVLSAALVFGPLVWLLGRWREAVGRDPGSALGVRWLGEHLSAHPCLTVGVLLFGVGERAGDGDPGQRRQAAGGPAYRSCAV